MQLVGWSCDWRNSQHACFTSINWSMLAAGNRIWVWKKNEYSTEITEWKTFVQFCLSSYFLNVCLQNIPFVWTRTYVELETMVGWPQRDNGGLAVKLSSFSRDAGLNPRISAYFIYNVDCRTLACTKLNLSIYWGSTLPDKASSTRFRACGWGCVRWKVPMQGRVWLVCLADMAWTFE